MAEQMKLMTDCLQQLTGSVANQDQQIRILTQLMGSLSNQNRNLDAKIDLVERSVRNFEYDPAINETFDLWYSRYEAVFIQDGAELEDKILTRILTRKLSSEVYNRYAGLILPKKPHELTFAETVKYLKTYFGSTKSLFSIRMECLNMIKPDGEDLITYASKVNKAVEDGKFAEMTNDQWKCLIFVQSLTGPEDGDLRHRLLSMLDKDEFAELTLSKMLEEAHRMRVIATDAKEIQIKQEPQASFNIVKSKQHSKQVTPTKSNELLPNRPCWQCGGIHFVKDCLPIQ